MAHLFRYLIIHRIQKAKFYIPFTLQAVSHTHYLKETVATLFDILFPFLNLGSSLMNKGKILQLEDLGYEEMAGIYRCTVTSTVGQSSGTSTLDVYCRYYIQSYFLKISLLVGHIS